MAEFIRAGVVAFLWWVMALLALVPGPASAQSGKTASRVSFRPVGVPPDVAVAGFEVNGPAAARYYLLGKLEATASRMVIFVPGSGCDGAFALGADGHAKAGPEAFALKYATEAKLVVLEAPGIPRQFAAPEHGLSRGCPTSFLTHSDMDHLLASYRTAVDDALSTSDGRIRVLMFVGVSDGAVTAAALARVYKQTTHITLISGFGSDQVTSQVDDLVGAVLDAPSKSEPRQALASFTSRLNAIREKPAANVSWRGQTEVHWASTAGRASSIEVAALPLAVKTFLVQGGADMSWPAANFRRGLADLLVAGRHTWIRYIPCADHHLICPDEGGAPKNLANAVDSAVGWFIDGRPAPDWELLP